MGQEWYYALNGKQEGPVSGTELKRLAGSGELRATDLVWTEGMKEWSAASSVKGLFPVAAPPRPPGPPPFRQPAARARSAEEPLEALPVDDESDLEEAAEEPRRNRSAPDRNGASRGDRQGSRRSQNWDENDPSTWKGIQGHAGTLDVYEDRVVITPQGILGMMTRGLAAGTCELPYRSMTAIQFKEAGPILTGYITFDTPGIQSRRRGGDRSQSNTFIFRLDRNALMKRVKEYVQRRIADINKPAPAQASIPSKADEIAKLAALLKEGHITQEEFSQMKKDILARPS